MKTTIARNHRSASRRVGARRRKLAKDRNQIRYILETETIPQTGEHSLTVCERGKHSTLKLDAEDSHRLAVLLCAGGGDAVNAGELREVQQCIDALLVKLGVMIAGGRMSNVITDALPALQALRFGIAGDALSLERLAAKEAGNDPDGPWEIADSKTKKAIVGKSVFLSK